MFPLPTPCTATLLVNQESINSNILTINFIVTYIYSRPFIQFCSRYNHLSKLMLRLLLMHTPLSILCSERCRFLELPIVT